MQRTVAILCALLVVAGLLGSCSRKGRIIPRRAMEDIYYDMFMADQWLNDHYAARKVADTTLFYEPVFRSHGYSFKDFDRSVSHYLKNPEKFSKMFKRVEKRLKDRSKKHQAVLTAIQNYHEPGGYSPSEFTSDSLVWADSIVRWVRPFLPPLVRDTVFHCDSLCPFRDSLGRCQCDSLCPYLDSIGCAVCDSLKACADTLSLDNKPI